MKKLLTFADIMKKFPPLRERVRERGAKCAFTLAEVLITLGIIGVVAALTIPSLVQNYRNHVVETRLKKFYTIFNQALLRSVADNGEMENWDWIADGDNWDENLEKYVLPYMTIVESKYLPEYPNNNKFYFLPDGSSFTTLNSLIYFPSDPVKCKKNDTKYGVCKFMFQFRNKPVEEPDSKSKYISRKGLDPYKFNWDGTEAGLYSGVHGCNTGLDGYFCTALIQYNGWKIPKNYPRKVKL